MEIVSFVILFVTVIAVIAVHYLKYHYIMHIKLCNAAAATALACSVHLCFMLAGLHAIFLIGNSEIWGVDFANVSAILYFLIRSIPGKSSLALPFFLAIDRVYLPSGLSSISLSRIILLASPTTLVINSSVLMA